ncbi:MAG: hypothetical protein QOJ64_715 [Acidobacteriota bacterium]|nr:hypothetical protein [Acidobacteriota bacterium]
MNQTNSTDAKPIANLWMWRGSVGRGTYFALGATLFAIKHLLDRFVAWKMFGLRWSFFNYWVFVDGTGVDHARIDHLRFYATLVAIAIPFIWVGIVLTLRRLRDIGWPLWLVAAFFLPFVNVLFFLLLSMMPSRMSIQRPSRATGFKDFLDRVIPRSGFGSALAGVIVTSLLAIGITLLSVQGLGSYGWGLFIGLPFFLGLTSVLVYGYHQERGLGMCVVISIISVGLACATLIAVAIEGLICILMAAPLGLIMAIFGGMIGYVIQRRPAPQSPGYGLHAFSIILLALPALMVVERMAQTEPPLREVRTSVEINASPEDVWQRLIAFGELAPPEEWLFKTGIAYPIRAEIKGSGVGAVRNCVFSTGAFVEPIEVWDEPRLLKFGVTSQPPIMEEMSPYAHLSPPHLDNYLQSRKGQFLLTRLSNGHTLLEGTTWYQNRFWPAAYWGLWSDHIIHRIHQRVLDHVKRLSEQATAGAAQSSEIAADQKEK